MVQWVQPELTNIYRDVARGKVRDFDSRIIGSNPIIPIK